ncbi:MAG: PQQ-dependent sugar dehydrogenase [Propionibacteriaceae bacterium]|nr:PQQ-dependent sugar dehydrogenase [Propionibacteriaceae bacterium]
MNPTARHAPARLFGVVLTTLALASCGITPPGAPPSGSPSRSSLAPSATPSPGSPSAEEDDAVVASGLDAPWSIVFHRGTALVSERDTARIVEIGQDRTVREVARIDSVAPAGEGGLLGLAVDGSWLYAYYTTATDNRIERFELLGEPGALSLGSGEVILEGLPSAQNHNGGRIAFGPDHLLYVTVGDAGDRDGAQDLDNLAGKILRLTPEGAVPQDNPFPGSPVYSFGHRNPQGLAWDTDGHLFATEFGQNTWDELNLIEPGGNYGWPEAEGNADVDGLIDPMQQWATSEASPSGMAYLDGRLYIANLRGERLREVPLSDLTTSTERFVGELGRLRDVAVAPDGSLWLLTNNTDGRGSPRPGDDRILRIEPALG